MCDLAHWWQRRSARCQRPEVSCRKEHTSKLMQCSRKLPNEASLRLAESYFLRHQINCPGRYPLGCFWNSPRRYLWGTCRGLWIASSDAGVSLLRSHRQGCRWKSLRSGHHGGPAPTLDHHRPRGEGENAAIWERRLYLLQWPYSALYWQNVTEPAKVKCLQGPPLTSQSRPRRMDWR